MINAYSIIEMLCRGSSCTTLQHNISHRKWREKSKLSILFPKININLVRGFLTKRPIAGTACIKEYCGLNRHYDFFLFKLIMYTKEVW